METADPQTLHYLTPFVNLPPYLNQYHYLYRPWPPAACKPHEPEPPALAAFPLDIEVYDKNGQRVYHREMEINSIIFHLAETSQKIFDGIISRNFQDFTQLGIDLKREWTDLCSALELIHIEFQTEPSFYKPFHQYWYHLYNKHQPQHYTPWIRTGTVDSYRRTITTIVETLLSLPRVLPRARSCRESDITRVRNLCMRLDYVSKLYPADQACFMRAPIQRQQ